MRYKRKADFDQNPSRKLFRTLSGSPGEPPQFDTAREARATRRHTDRSRIAALRLAFLQQRNTTTAQDTPLRKADRLRHAAPRRMLLRQRNTKTAQDTPFPSMRATDTPNEIQDGSDALHEWRAVRDRESIYEEERARMKHSWRLQHSNLGQENVGIGAQSLADAIPDDRTSLSRTVPLGRSAMSVAHSIGSVLWRAVARVLQLATGSVGTLTPAHFLAASFVAMSALQFITDILIICIGIAPWIFVLASGSLSSGYRAVAPYLRICGIMSFYLLIQSLIALLTCLDTAAMLGRRLLLRPTLRAMHSPWKRPVAYTTVVALMIIIYIGVFNRDVFVVPAEVQRMDDVQLVRR
ncbi:uncharacterized protein B0H18DRAFT_1121802 [Fomitopsis serialis]|uniref:uncharacterized protein n=1 Tax=Fomitopsis serialis TaxID=139415 RepID=UPI002007ACCF|nr:uncharacterized protein B0H18DRAFT_1121802 [Neoantrodia serialis]KAH9920710.1 hypothetical protein B0H18DRAFT_1121802 [Neoantrodia serialis]